MTGGLSGKELLAAINASLNGLSAMLLIAAFVTSAVFLGFYLTSYFKFGDRSSGLQPGPLRTFYFVLLASHVLLAVVVLPMIIATVWRAYGRKWDLHRKIARPTYWIWLYVSITGVVVYWLLYHLFPAMRA